MDDDPVVVALQHESRARQRQVGLKVCPQEARESGGGRRGGRGGGRRRSRGRRGGTSSANSELGLGYAVTAGRRESRGGGHDSRRGRGGDGRRGEIGERGAGRAFWSGGQLGARGSCCRLGSRVTGGRLSRGSGERRSVRLHACWWSRQTVESGGREGGGVGRGRGRSQGRSPRQRPSSRGAAGRGRRR